MASRYQNFNKGIGLVPNSADQNTVTGDLNVVTSSGKLYFYNGTQTTQSSPIATEAHSAVFTNKTLDFDTGTTGNIISNVPDSALSANVLLVNGVQTVTGAKSFNSNTILFNGSTSGATTLNASAIASGTLTLPAATDTLVGRDTTDVLTNKTLTGNTAASLINAAGTINFNSTGTITVPNTTDTLVGINTTDTLTNKTIDGNNNTLLNIPSSALPSNVLYTDQSQTVVLAGAKSFEPSALLLKGATSGFTALNAETNASGTITLPHPDAPATTDTLVLINKIQTVYSKTLDNPILLTPTTDTIKNKTGSTELVLDTVLATDTIELKNAGSLIATVDATGLELDTGNTVRFVNTGILSLGASTGSATYSINFPASAPAVDTALVYDGSDFVWSSIATSEVTTTGTAGEVIAAKDAVYISNADGKVYRLDASNDAKIEFIGFAEAGANLNDPITIQIAGEITGLSGLSRGKPVFADPANPGKLVTVAPWVVGEWIVPVGLASTTSSLVINAAGSATAVKVVSNAAPGATLYQSLDFNVSGPYYLGGSSQTEVMLDRAITLLSVSDAKLLVQTAGSGGTTEVDIEYSTNNGGTWTSIFATRPSVASSAGNYAVSTNAVLTSNPLSLAAGTLLRLNITSVQSGTPNGFILQLIYGV